jgi:hypothetical protein
MPYNPPPLRSSKVIATGGASGRSVADRFADRLHLKDFTGSDPTGVADSTTAINFAASYLGSRGGGLLDLSDGIWLANSANISLPEGVVLTGPWRNPGEVTNSDYSAKKGRIILGAAYTISCAGASSGVEGLIITRSGLIAPTSMRQALDVAAAFAGTAITFNNHDCWASNLLILGFGTAIYCHSFERPHVQWVSGDCTNGLDFNFVTDMDHVRSCHFWPFMATHKTFTKLWNVSGAVNNGAGLIRLITAVAHPFVTGDTVTVQGIVGTTEANDQRWTVTVIDSTHLDLQGSTFTNAYTSGGVVNGMHLTRKGTAYKFFNVVDWGQGTDLFSYGYDNGFWIDGCDYTTWINCGADGTASGIGDPTPVGMQVTGTTKAATFIGCKTAGQGKGFVGNSTAGQERSIILVGHRSWGNLIYLYQLTAGIFKLSACMGQKLGTVRIDIGILKVTFIGGDFEGAIFSVDASAGNKVSYIEVEGNPSGNVFTKILLAIASNRAFLASNNANDASTSMTLFQQSTTANQKFWDWFADTSRNMHLRTASDDFTTFDDVLVARRGSGVLVESVEIPRNPRLGASAPATNATNGFVYVPAMSGTPTGTPTAYTGMVPMCIDITGSKLWAYIGGAWKSANLT